MTCGMCNKFLACVGVRDAFPYKTWHSFAIQGYAIFTTISFLMLDVDFYVSLDFLVLDSHENGKIGIIPFPGLYDKPLTCV